MVLIWVCLPWLPLIFWLIYFFCKGNILGFFYEEDISFIQTKYVRMGHILIDLNLTSVLQDTISSHGGYISHLDTMDYEGILFKCGCCQKYGPLSSDSSLQKTRKMLVKNIFLLLPFMILWLDVSREIRVKPYSQLSLQFQDFHTMYTRNQTQWLICIPQ